MFDLQINGLTTKDFSCNFWQGPSEQQIQALCQYQFNQGVKKFLATLITDDPQRIKKSLQIIRNYQDKFSQKPNQAYLLGVHLEGGLITRLGVHPAEYSQVFDYQAVKELIAEFPGLIKLWTLCPKLDPDGNITKLLQDQGIKVSYGHSDADYVTAWQAFEKYQVDLVTHWGNAMYVASGFRQRDCRDEDLDRLDSEFDEKQMGIGLAAYRHPKVTLMVICGSQANHDLHLDPRLIKKLLLKKKNQIILVSDSVAYNSNTAPETLVGGLATLKTHAENALQCGFSYEDIKMATEILPQDKLLP